MKPKAHGWLPWALIAVFALSRVPGLMPDNFSAAYALAFCAGVYFCGSMAWWLPLSALVLSGTLLNYFYYGFPILDGYVGLTYFGFAMLIAWGRLFRRWRGFWPVVGGGLMGAVIFYLVTNTIAWLYEPTQPYPKTLLGWIQALTRGTSGWPETWTFFRNTLLSSGLFTALFAGAFQLAEASEEKEETETEAEPQTESPPVETEARGG